jgi:hypothetical protein
MRSTGTIVYVLKVRDFEDNPAYIAPSPVTRARYWQVADKMFIHKGDSIDDNAGIRLLIGYLIPLEDDDG